MEDRLLFWAIPTVISIISLGFSVNAWRRERSIVSTDLALSLIEAIHRDPLTSKIFYEIEWDYFDWKKEVHANETTETEHAIDRILSVLNHFCSRARLGHVRHSEFGDVEYYLTAVAMNVGVNAYLQHVAELCVRRGCSNPYQDLSDWIMSRGRRVRRQAK